MNIKKFVSGISAFAVAVTAFAAMAVTASADTTYTDVPVTPVAQNKMTDNGDGTFTSDSDTNTAYALALADFSNLPYIGKASIITIDFKTAIGNSRMAFCLGDKSQRGTNAAGSTGTSFKYDGVAMFFGSLGTNSYKINNIGDNLASSAFNKTVKAHIVINKKTGKLFYRLTDTNNTLLAENTTGIAPYNNKAKTVDVIEAYTWANGVKAQFTDVKVSYTVPAEVGALGEVDVTDDVEGDGVYARAFTSYITSNGNTITKVNVTVLDSNEGTQTIDSTKLTLSDNGGVLIGIILASENQSRIESFDTTKIKITVE